MELAGGTAYQPEDVALMRTVLDEATTILPVHQRTPAMKALREFLHRQPKAFRAKIFEPLAFLLPLRADRQIVAPDVAPASGSSVT
jgi:hypothetical protein